MMLTIEAYDAAEQEARIGLSFAEIMAFAPRTFANLGLPDRVKDERELVRYADWNLDAENREYFRPGQFFGGPAVQTDYTQDEVDLMNRVRDQAVEVTQRMGRPVRPLSGPFAQLGFFRIISALRAAQGRALDVFEVGPGTGYLGAMLLNYGNTYAWMDNAQALYLWQHRLVGDRARGVPWWEFVRAGIQRPVDIVVSNANLGEMTHDAMRIMVRHAKEALKDSPLGIFMFTHVGAPMHNGFEGVDRELRSIGFRHVFSRLFQGYLAHDRVLPDAVMALQNEIPLFNPSGRPERFTGAQAVSIPKDQEPLDLDFVRRLGKWEPPS
jgi:hypothetical protein